MITISEAVNEIIEDVPYLEEAITQGIINTSALARMIQKPIEVKLLKKVKSSAIGMALKRMKTKIYHKANPKFLFQKKPDLIVRSNLVEYTLENSDMIVNSIKKLLERNPPSFRKYFLAFTRGVFETAVITSVDWIHEVDNILKGEKIIGKEENLSALTIILPENNVTTPGIYYVLLKSLAWYNINIIDVISTREEFTLICKENEIDRAFSVLTKTLQ